MKRVGIYSGTFDPVHAGHIAFAEKAIGSCGLDYVVFLPEKSPRAKHNVSPHDQRFAELRAITLIHPALKVANAPEEQFTTIQSLPWLQKKFGDQLVLLIGTDTLAHMHLWTHLDMLLQTMTLAIGLREGADHAFVSQQIASLEEIVGHAIPHKVIDTDKSKFSSSQFRRSLRS